MLSLPILESTQGSRLKGPGFSPTPMPAPARTENIIWLTGNWFTSINSWTGFIWKYSNYAATNVFVRLQHHFLFPFKNASGLYLPYIIVKYLKMAAPSRPSVIVT